mmetsp:Transcript_111813/g.216661  ORF Transcript_111813/g.216661 Transcript_111813/m.216661 type:complete len:289 (-) Transcript_111813:358-1224(-)
MAPAAWDVPQVAKQLPIFMDVDKAQRTPVVKLPGFLSLEEVRHLERTIRTARNEEGVFFGETSLLADASILSLCCRSRYRGGWHVSYLHTSGWFRSTFPDLKCRMFEAVSRVDAEQQWHLLSPEKTEVGDVSPLGKDSKITGLLADDVQLQPEKLNIAEKRCKAQGCNVRCAEYHVHCGPSPALPDRYHHDTDSLVTLDILLTDSSEFQGGVFQTLEADSTMNPVTWSVGDALVFVSHKYHCVQKVLAGERRVLVLEFWRGPECRCPHRCLAEWPYRACGKQGFTEEA